MCNQANTPASDWVMVPREPTDAMLEASVGTRESYLTDAHVAVLKDGFAARYRAMIAVSPEPQPEVAAEPVAWRCEDLILKGVVSIIEDREHAEMRRETGGWKITPLYAGPLLGLSK